MTNRKCGVILHPTSLPGVHGIGDFGQGAYNFIDVLVQMKQSLWQILPLGPTGFGNSPYMSLSAFAGNPLLISLHSLIQDGLLTTADLEPTPCFSNDYVDYEKVNHYKLNLLKKAAQAFCQNKVHPLWSNFHQFYEKQRDWLDDFSLFCSLKVAHELCVWTQWDKSFVNREPIALDRAKEQFKDDIFFHQFLQFIFFKQWLALKQYANQKGIQIIGDVPIYVAHDSADVWSNPQNFFLDNMGHPTVVAGVPPDYYSSTGQRWGNPIYRWKRMEDDGYCWWINRIEAMLTQVDMIRIDHFRGLEAYWEILESEPTAQNGRWVKGPGAQLLTAITDKLGDVPFIAEDLGVITPEVEALRDQFGLPGMRVLQVAFSTDTKASDYLPHNYIENCVAYTATHDHNTTVGWFTAEPGSETTQTPREVEDERRYVLEYFKSDGRDIHWDMIKAVLQSKARMAVYPLQDILGLNSQARMNRPGVGASNWQWRFSKTSLTQAMMDQLVQRVVDSDRVP